MEKETADNVIFNDTFKVMSKTLIITSTQRHYAQYRVVGRDRKGKSVVLHQSNRLKKKKNNNSNKNANIMTT